MASYYDDLVKAFIRPQRKMYDALPIGKHPVTIGNVYAWRTSFNLTNRSKQVLFCSLYEPMHPSTTHSTTNSCVIYCHGNAGCQLDGLPVVQRLIQTNTAVCCFDFSGSGLSGGQYITLGWKERNDLDDLFTHLLTWKRYASIGIWGRSMGAATAIFFAASKPHHPQLAFLILDSPFSSLTELAISFGSSKASFVPDMLLRLAIGVIGSSITSKTGADISKLNPLTDAPKIHIPTLFGVAQHDDLTPPSMVEQIYKACRGAPKALVFMKGTHYGDRPQEWFEPAVQFAVKNAIKRGISAPQRKATTFNDFPINHQHNTSHLGIKKTNTSIFELRQRRNSLNDSVALPSPPQIFNKAGTSTNPHTNTTNTPQKTPLASPPGEDKLGSTPPKKRYNIYNTIFDESCLEYKPSPKAQNLHEFKLHAKEPGRAFCTPIRRKSIPFEDHKDTLFTPPRFIPHRESPGQSTEEISSQNELRVDVIQEHPELHGGQMTSSMDYVRSRAYYVDDESKKIVQLSPDEEPDILKDVPIKLSQTLKGARNDRNSCF